MKRLHLFPFCLLGLACMGQTSAPAAAESPTIAVADTVDGTRMLADLAFLSSDELEGRGAGTPGGEAARAYVRAAFEEAGLSEVSEVPFQFRGDRTGVNVLGRVEGAEPELGVIVLTAHYDHLGIRNGQIFNGADDNASGTAAIMELARQLVDSPLRRSVLVVALDAEEQGLQGARALVRDFPLPLESVDLNINLDMVSRSEAGEIYAAGTHHYPQLRELLEPVLAELPVRVILGHDLPGTGSNDWTNASDHAAFHAEDIPFLYFGVEDHAGYHNPTDDFEDITPEFFVGAVLSIERVLRHLDAQLPD